MKTLHAAIITGLLITANATAQVNLPQPGLPGSSPDTAVRIVVGNEIMADRLINRWLRTHYPGWTAGLIEFTDIAFERYAVVQIRADNNPSRRVYFRIQNAQDPRDNDGPSFP